MDPEQTYLSLCRAMRRGEYDDAREHALALQGWLDKGGFIPKRFHQGEFRSYVNRVIRATGGTNRED